MSGECSISPPYKGLHCFQQGFPGRRRKQGRSIMVASERMGRMEEVLEVGFECT